MRSDIKLMGISLLWGCSFAPFNVLSVALTKNGMSKSEIGIVIASGSVTTLIATFTTGSMLERFGARKLLILALTCAAVGISLLEVTAYSVIGASTASMIRGFGAGCFIVAGVILVRSAVDPGEQIYKVGLFTSFIMMPTIIIPEVAVAYLERTTDGFFILSALPLIAAIAIALTLAEATAPKKLYTETYAVVLSKNLVRLGCFTVACTGVWYAFASGFLALYLQEKNLNVSLFFTPFVAMLLASRFVFMRKLQQLKIEALIMLGMLAFTLPLLLFLAPSITTMILAGASFGLGYSIVYPSSFKWLCDRYPQYEGRLVALINTSFQSGLIVSSLAVGVMVGYMSWEAVIACLIVLSIIALVRLERNRT